MKKSLFVALTATLFATTAFAAIKGDYIEVRSADVYTGPCFANAQVGLVGDQAILAWRVREGSWNGVNLSGRSIVAIVKASATLGDPYHNPLPAKAILVVDRDATPQQVQALRQMASSMAGGLIARVIRVETAPIGLSIGEGAKHGSVSLSAGDFARIRTRSLAACDLICGNEETYYRPLATGLSHAMPAYTLEEAFLGDGLGSTWHRVNTRSAFVGSFSF